MCYQPKHAAPYDKKAERYPRHKGHSPTHKQDGQWVDRISGRVADVFVPPEDTYWVPSGPALALAGVRP